MLINKDNFTFLQKELLEEIEKHAILKNIKAEKILLNTHQNIKETILVNKGKIKVYIEGEDGGDFFMYYLKPGDACALSIICALRNEKSKITLKVIEDSEIIFIPTNILSSWKIKYPSWFDFILNTYHKNFEELLIVIDNIAFKAMDERLEFYLKRQHELCNCKDIKLSHQEIANDLNTSREVVSRLLKKMKQRKLITLNRNHIKLLNY